MINLNNTLKEMGSHIHELMALAVIGRDGMTVAEYNPAGMNLEGVYARFAMVLIGVEKSVNELEALGHFEDNLVLVKTEKVIFLIKLLGPRFFLGIAVSCDCPLNKVLALIKRYYRILVKEL
jgi:predicted regulator of Ras-like GTPase activity (Roadblock/LC7/MglB family)